MGLIDRFMRKLMRRTPDEIPADKQVHRTHHSCLGTKAERRTRRKIAHESRRVNFQGR